MHRSRGSRERANDERQPARSTRHRTRTPGAGAAVRRSGCRYSSAVARIPQTLQLGQATDLSRWCVTLPSSISSSCAGVESTTSGEKICSRTQPLRFVISRANLPMSCANQSSARIRKHQRHRGAQVRPWRFCASSLVWSSNGRRTSASASLLARGWHASQDRSSPASRSSPSAPQSASPARCCSSGRSARCSSASRRTTSRRARSSSCCWAPSPRWRHACPRAAPRASIRSWRYKTSHVCTIAREVASRRPRSGLPFSVEEPQWTGCRRAHHGQVDLLAPTSPMATF